MTGNSSRPADWRMDESSGHVRPGSRSSSRTRSSSVTFDFAHRALAFHTPVNPSRLGQSSTHSVLLTLAADGSRSHPASLHIKAACTLKNTAPFFRGAFFLVHSIFHLHSRGCLISFHFQFFTVTLYQRPICQRATKSHYSYTCGKNRPFILIVVVNTNQWGY